MTLHGPDVYRYILANPADDVARLAYADWLEECGREAYAQFVVTQVRNPWLWAIVDAVRPGAWRMRAQQCNPGLGLDLSMTLPLNVGFGTAVHFRRGFAEHVFCPFGEWENSGGAFVESSPIRAVHATDKRSMWLHLVNSACAWFPSIVPDQEFEILAEVYDLIVGEERLSADGLECKRFDAEADADAALSDALIKWVKA